MQSPEHQVRAVREYMELECADEKIVQLEKVSSETVSGTKYDVWDVHTDKGRWWVITEPTNLYRQADFPSLENALTFHIGLWHRIAAQHELPVSDDERARFPQTLRRWKEAAAALDGADEAEEFQTVGMRCRECLLALVREAGLDALVPEGTTTPKRGDFLKWSEVIANGVFAGSSAERLRGYTKAAAKETWELAQWLTHATNATSYDADIALQAMENIVQVFVTAIRRWEHGAPDRCPECGSYRIVSDFRVELAETSDDDPYVTLCEACGWEEDRKK
jgi:hypothetical protein